MSWALGMAISNGVMFSLSSWTPAALLSPSLPLPLLEEAAVTWCTASGEHRYPDNNMSESDFCRWTRGVIFEDIVLPPRDGFAPDFVTFGLTTFGLFLMEFSGTLASWLRREVIGRPPLLSLTPVVLTGVDTELWEFVVRVLVTWVTVGESSSSLNILKSAVSGWKSKVEPGLSSLTCGALSFDVCSLVEADNSRWWLLFWCDWRWREAWCTLWEMLCTASGVETAKKCIAESEISV